MCRGLVESCDEPAGSQIHSVGKKGGTVISAPTQPQPQNLSEGKTSPKKPWQLGRKQCGLKKEKRS